MTIKKHDIHRISEKEKVETDTDMDRLSSNIIVTE